MHFTSKWFDFDNQSLLEELAEDSSKNNNKNDSIKVRWSLSVSKNLTNLNIKAK